MDVIVLPIFTDVIFEHERNALFPIDVTPSHISTVAKLPQPLNALFPIEFTLPGMSNDVREEHD